MVSTKTFDNIDKEKIHKDLDRILNSLSEDLEKVQSDLMRKAVLKLIDDVNALKIKTTLFIVAQCVINILLGVGFILK